MFFAVAQKSVAALQALGLSCSDGRLCGEQSRIAVYLDRRWSIEVGSGLFSCLFAAVEKRDNFILSLASSGLKVPMM